jgi:hypothetical protein
MVAGVVVVVVCGFVEGQKRKEEKETILKAHHMLQGNQHTVRPQCTTRHTVHARAWRAGTLLRPEHGMQRRKGAQTGSVHSTTTAQMANTVCPQPTCTGAWRVGPRRRARRATTRESPLRWEAENGVNKA